MATSKALTGGALDAQARSHDGWSRDRELLRELVRRDLRARYRGSILGVAWSLLNPLLYMVVYTIVFSTIMRFPVSGAPYPVFLLAGLLGWNFFSQAVSGSVNSVVGNAVLIKKLAFRRSLLTVSSVTAAFVNYLISLVLLVPLVLLFHVPVGLPLVLLPVLVILIFAVALGISLMVAAANVYFRDIEYLMTISLQVWFFLTPIIYQIDLIVDRAAKSNNPLAPAFQWLLYANPLTWLATSAQDVIAFNRWPQHWYGLGYSTLFALVSLALGYALFQRMQVRFAEEL